MLFIYRLIINLIFLATPIIIIYRIFKKKEDPKRFFEKIGKFNKKNQNDNLIWFHGSSVGLGVMGFHSFLQKNRIPLESVMAKSWNKKIFKQIDEKVNQASKELAEER